MPHPAAYAAFQRPDMVACSISSSAGNPITKSGYMALFDKAEPMPFKTKANATHGMVFGVGCKPPKRSQPHAAVPNGASKANVNARNTKPVAVTPLYTRAESGNRSMTQPTGTEKMTYTMDEYIKNKDTHEALRRNGGAESLYARVGSNVATMMPDRVTELKPMMTEADRTELSACRASLTEMELVGMNCGTRGKSMSGALAQTKNGIRKADFGSSGNASYETPPITGPTMHPTPDTVPIDAITSPKRSWKQLDTMAMHAVSARAPVRPLRKYVMTNKAFVPSPLLISGANPKSNVKSNMQNKPNSTALRAPRKRIH
mmetsp:Transcript_1415/g.3012  ORF Transcript_1415/g.3012 Transcript_1415/m.3012 type:complete len:317 (+) Transcript_1415:757-1707(+)